MKATVLLVWALWFTTVTLTNLCDALKHLGVLPSGFSFASGNFAFMQTVTAIHRVPVLLVAVMFAGVILWEALATVLFYRAFAKSQQRSPDANTAVTHAFIVSVAFWGTMMIASEVFISYDVESTHIRLLIASLVSFIVTAYRWDTSASSDRGRT